MITVNGEPRELPRAGSMVADLVTEAVGAAPEALGQLRGVAVALNGEVLPRAAWAGTEVSDGDRLEVLTATQGG